MPDRKLDARLAVTPETRDRLKRFASGLAVPYEDAINALLDQFSRPYERPESAGYRMRGMIEGWNQPEEQE